MKQSELLSGNPYDLDYKTCPKCYHKVHKTVLEHTCASSSVPRLEDKPSSTAESDYALLRDEKPQKQTEYVNEERIDENFLEILKYYTYCTFCKETTEWTHKPDSYYWVCKCGKIQGNPLNEKWFNYFVPTLEPEFKSLTLEPGYMKPVYTIYLSGPMTGLPDYNAAEFKKYAEKYRSWGFVVKSPPELDNGDTGKPYEYYIKRDVRVLLEDGIDRIYLLPGWQKSKGANLEVHLAKMFKIPIYDTQTDELWEEDVLQEARRLVSGDRGKDYGHPFDDFSRTAGMLTSAFNHKIKEGVKFEPEDIAIIMMLVKISRLINSPDHRDSGVDIGGYDLTYWMVRIERALREARNDMERSIASTSGLSGQQN